MAIPTDPETLLTRAALAEALTEAGFPVSRATLATKASRGGGPPFRKFGPRALYQWRLGLEWAKSKLGPEVGSTAELEANLSNGAGTRHAKLRSRSPRSRRKRATDHLAHSTS
jgi:hypothetical protein